MVNKDRTQFLIECKNGEAANILYGLLHDKTLFLPELSLVNAHPKMFDSDFPLDFPHNMDIDSRYILNLDREEFAKELQQLFDADKIAYVELVVATDARNTRRIVVLTDPTRADKMSQKHLYGGLLLLLVMVQVMERFHVRKSACILRSFGATTKDYSIAEKESVSIQAHTKLAAVDVICFALTTTALFLFCNM